jgi:hypothetical protein
VIRTGDARSRSLITTPTVPVPRAERPTHAKLEAAALLFARELHAHLLEGLAHGCLAAVLSVGRSAEHLVGPVGPTLAAQAFLRSCRTQ